MADEKPTTEAVAEKPAAKKPATKAAAKPAAEKAEKAPAKKAPAKAAADKAAALGQEGRRGAPRAGPEGAPPPSRRGRQEGQDPRRTR